MAATVIRTSGEMVPPMPTILDSRLSIVNDLTRLNEDLERASGRDVVVLRATRRSPARLAREKAS